ncbi:MAG: hypothetical protein ACD_35C00118G0001 [uncultured bacterium]|nr:MAG: hypothetical protein ACD_35C00118G0001 [uncultured bacterium]
MLEKNFENVLQRYPELIEEDLIFSGRQISISGKFVDLLYIDRFGQKLIIELKKGIIKREHIAQLMDYEGHFLTADNNPNIRVMLIGNRVPINLRNSLDHHGFEWKEIPVTELVAFLKNKNDAELLEQFEVEQSIPIESKKETISIEADSKNKEKWDGYLRQNGISESGNSKQAQALSLFINGTTEEDYKKALPGYSKGFNVMLRFFIDNGFTSSVVNGKTFLKKSLLSASDKGIDPAQERRNSEPRYSNTSHFCRLPYTEKQNYRIDKALENFNSIEELVKSTGCTEQRIKSHIRYILKNCPHAVQEERGGKIRFVLKDL